MISYSYLDRSFFLCDVIFIVAVDASSFVVTKDAYA